MQVKRFLPAIYVLILACSVSAQERCSLANGKITAVIPLSYSRLTREEIERTFTEASPYILEFNPDVFGNAERTLIVSIFELSFRLETTDLEGYGKNLGSSFEAMGGENVKTEIIEVKKRQWVHISNDYSTVPVRHIETYVTPFGSRSLNLVLLKKNPADEQSLDTIRTIIESIDMLPTGAPNKSAQPPRSH